MLFHIDFKLEFIIKTILFTKLDAKKNIKDCTTIKKMNNYSIAF